MNHSSTFADHCWIPRGCVGVLAMALAALATGGVANGAAFDPADLNNGAINPGYTVGPDANPGGQTVFTNVFIPMTTYVDTPSTVTQNNYSVTIQGLINGTQSVYDQTFAVPYSDPSVQSAVAAAEATLNADGATSILGPTLASNSTTLSGSQTTYTQTGSSSTTIQDTGTVDVFGPTATYNQVVGNSGYTFEPTFTVFGGQLDLVVENTVATTIDRNAVTTHTYLTTQTYVINGVSVPEPTAGLALLVLGVRPLLRRRTSLTN